MKCQRGFSLIEVLLAFSLLAASLGILIAILSSGLLQVANAADATEATLHAQSLLDELGVLEPIEPGRDEGVLDKGRYRWELDIAEVPDPVPLAIGNEGEGPIETVGLQAAAPPVLYRVQLDVHWGQGDYARSLRFVTLRARLPESPLQGVP